MSSSVAQGIYAPLPQSISDSDSEEELHSSLKLPARKPSDGHAGNGQLKEYQHLEDGELNGFPPTGSHLMDDVPIIKDGYKRPMSPARKLLFVLSIAACFLTMVVFLWVLPCSESATCSAAAAAHQTSNWEKPYLDIELMGPINVVEGASGHSRNLVFIFRKDVVEGSGSGTAGGSAGGAVSIVGDTGKVAWFVTHPRVPTDIDCSLLDVDRDGQPDCVIAGEGGLLTALNPLYGNVHWYAHSRTGTDLSDVQFPVLIADVDGDRVDDLLAVAAINGSRANQLVVVSGQDGRVLLRATAPRCDRLSGLRADASFVSYSCHAGPSAERRSLAVRDFFEQTFNRSDVRYLPAWAARRRPHQGQQDSYVVEGRQLVVRNQGHCPGRCNVSVQLLDQRAGRQGNVTWAYRAAGMYAMVPTVIRFKDTRHNLDLLQGHVNGYILKFWQWKPPRYPGSSSRDKRSLPAPTPASNLTEQHLLERLVLITFNSTSFNIVNASQSEVTQLCTGALCQPNLAYQENSVLVADLDRDGSQELITYLSTFVFDDADKQDRFKLQSNVKVIRLENELPKLYEAVYKP